MYCKNCGSIIPDDAKFCSSCGAELNVEPVELNTVAPPFPPKKVLTPAILGLAFACTWILSLLGIIFSGIALSRAKKFVAATGTYNGAATARVGKILGIVGLVTNIFLLVMLILYVFIIVVAVLAYLAQGGVQPI